MEHNFTSKHFDLVKVKEGIYAAIAKDGGGAVGNAGFIDLGDKTIVFDTFNTQQAASDLKNAAEMLTNQPVSWVINSHYHGDHIRGNQIFTSSHILASETTFAKIKEIQPARLDKQKQDLVGLENYIQSLQQQYEETRDNRLHTQISFLQEIAVSLPSLELTLPQYTFKEEFTFHGLMRTVKLFTMGSGHSYCDSFLYIPEDHVIFMGDLLFVDTHPSFFEESNLDNWMRILDEIQAWDIDKAVPGHGPVGTRSDLNKIIQYIKDLKVLSKSEVELEQIQIPFPYRDWALPELFQKNLKHLYESVRS